MATGFFVPDSISSSYVANKRNEEGGLLYESAANDVGISKQQAVQTLEHNYSQVIENAYASHLAANKSILGSNMGQGYKEAYLQAQQEELQRGIAEANLSAASARQELGLQEAQAQQQIMSAFQSEVGNFDRAAQSMNDYLAYVKSLTSQDGATGYLTDEYANLGVDELYHVLFEAQPQGFVDVEGNAGMNFLDWTRSKLGTSSSDEAYRQWLYGQGGYQELRTQLSAKSQNSEGWQKLVEEQKKKEEEIKAKEEQNYDEEKSLTKYNTYRDLDSKVTNGYAVKGLTTYAIKDGDEVVNYKYGNTDNWKVKDEDTIDNLKRIMANLYGENYANKENQHYVIKYHGEYYVARTYTDYNKGYKEDGRHAIEFVKLQKE